MRVDGFLCDAATVREGLLHILGGGVTRVWRTSFPAQLGIELALMLTLTRAEAHEGHKFRVVIQTADGKRLAEMGGEFKVNPSSQLQPGEMVQTPIVVDMKGIPIPQAGTYSAEILVNGRQSLSISFVVASPPQPADKDNQ